jgi:rubredoxin
MDKNITTTQKYVCDLCGWVYDPTIGFDEEGINAGTTFEQLPDDFVCPECGAGKEYFSPITE